MMNKRNRVLSFLLALCLLIGMVPMMSTPAEAVYHTENAPVATEEQLLATSERFAATTGGAMLRIIDGDLWVWGKNT